MMQLENDESNSPPWLIKIIQSAKSPNGRGWDKQIQIPVSLSMLPAFSFSIGGGA
jgi:hypothetical protein